MDLHVRDRAAVGVVTAGARGLLGGVRDDPDGGDRGPEQIGQRGRAAREQRQRGELAVVRERPEDGVEVAGVQHRRQRPGGHGVLPCSLVRGLAAAVAERARGDVVRAVEPVDDAQALADAVLRVHALARRDGGEEPGHDLAAEQRVALWDRGVRREHHPGITSVVNVASRPRRTALTTGAAMRSP
jgi:hypothetical protein